MNLRQIIFVAACAALLTGSMSGCDKSNKDSVIKADLASKAESEKDFAGVRFTVENGIVSLSGQCATEKAKATVESTVKKLYGVKDEVSNITIGPVVIGTDQLLKQGVDSVLKHYAGVEAITRDSLVFLQGKIERDKFEELLEAINQLQPKKIEQSLSMK